jgi:hypothetical protein
MLVESTTYQFSSLNESTRVPFHNREDPEEVTQLRSILLEMRNILDEHPKLWHSKLEETLKQHLQSSTDGSQTYHPTLAHFLSSELPAVLEMLGSHIS